MVGMEIIVRVEICLLSMEDVERFFKRVCSFDKKRIPPVVYL